MTLLSAPANLLDGADMKVQEAIHGHRILSDQEPFMIVLETLVVCSDNKLGSILPTQEQHEIISYRLPHKRKMRYLLFQDRHLESIASDNSIPDIEKWAEWKKRINDSFDPNNDGQDYFNYLDDPFSMKFDDLLHAVRLIKSMELDVMHNRRWTSRFLAVNGPEMICTDMKENGNRNWSPDRRFFSRCGELVYLMLNRSKSAENLNDLIQKKFLCQDTHLNRIAGKLNDPDENSSSNTSIGYLPYSRHPSYERLGKDWEAILSLPGLPVGHHFEPVFRITGLNLLVYLAERAQEEIGNTRAEPIIADFMDGADKQLRESSKEHLNRHRQAANKAVLHYIKRITESNEGWRIALEKGDPLAATRVIGYLFKYEIQEKHGKPPEQQLNELIEKAQKRSKNNAHKFLLPLIKESGIGSSRPGVGTWFKVEDSMILALVLANVAHTIELKEFVETLYDRYRIVIGPSEARKEFRRLPVGVQNFEANLDALEARMTRLALTRRLSDDCAFVTNPYWSGNGR